MWKPEHRRAADRTGLRYPSDLSDGEWLIVEPMIPDATMAGTVPASLDRVCGVDPTGTLWQWFQEGQQEGRGLRP